jgi:ABC-type Fe3+ transport system permease subunit
MVCFRENLPRGRTKKQKIILQEAQFMEQYSTPLTPEQQSHNKQSVTAMVLGIVSLVVTWFPIIGLVLAIVGLTMSRSNRRFAEAHGFKENSMNTAGYVTSVVGLIAGIITILVTLLIIAFGFVALAGLINYADMSQIFY